LFVCAFGRVPTPPAGPSLPINGQASYTLGINYPWKSYGADFGKNSWGYNGVATPATNTTVTNQFNDIKAKGGKVVRWWFLSDGRAGIVWGSDGTPQSLNTEVFNDIDAAVKIAKESNLYIVLSLFDFGWTAIPSVVSGVTLGGHADTITDANKRTALMNIAIIPILTRYANEPHILAYEIMNEPEWIISDLPQPSVNTKMVPVTMSQFWTFSAGIIDAVHTHTNQYVTVGSACLKWYRCFTPAFSKEKNLPVLDLDFYEVHYYSWMNGQSENNNPDLGTVNFEPAKQPVKNLAGVTLPIVVGEFDGSSGLTALLDAFLANGYAGAWPWSYNADFQTAWSDYTSWAKSHANIIH